jgi:serine/threonine protein kinase
LKIVQFYSDGSSLLEVLSVKPVWLTSTVKAKVITGIVLGLRFAHSLGLLHGSLITSNTVFDFDHCIQMVDFRSILLKVGESENESEQRTTLGGFSGEGWAPEGDIQAFASILFEIVVGQPAEFEASIPEDIPEFISAIIKSAREFKTGYSFDDIWKILKENEFQIEDGVDSAEVFEFVRWVESAEHPGK